MSVTTNQPRGLNLPSPKPPIVAVTQQNLRDWSAHQAALGWEPLTARLSSHPHGRDTSIRVSPAPFVATVNLAQPWQDIEKELLALIAA